MKSTSNITFGPAQIKIDDTDISHTQGGVTVNISPQNRMRTVDEFGTSAIEVVHQGDEVRVTAPMPEWSADVLSNVYDPGNNQTSSSTGDEYLGIGRRAGYVYADRDLKVVPYLTSQQSKQSQFYRAVPVGELEIVHNNEDDRVFNAEYTCLVDEEKDDGELIGKLFIDAVAA